MSKTKDKSVNKKSSSDMMWTPANIVTVIRICLVPIFVVVILSPWPDWFPLWPDANNWKPWVSAAVFILIAATDALDGYLARSRNEITDFGKFMDPLADKLLVTAALLALVELRILPTWVALIIIGREFIVSGVRMVAANKGQVIAASWYGKAKTFTQIIAIVLFIVKDSVLVTDTIEVLAQPLYIVSWVFMLAAVALTIISMLDYIAKSKDVLGFGKSDDKEKDDDNTVEFSVDEKCAALASNVVEAAIEKQITLACAESLTGGMICAALTSVPGSSAVIKGGINSYATSVKQEILGVEGAVIEKDGAVSASCASAMAKGVSERLGAHLSVAVTGVAGPDKDERRNEVGLVYIAVLFDGNVNVEEHKFKGNRNEIRNQTCICALEALARALS